ncbi:MAG: NAD(P)-dependent glycerol-3-phosphate dehydrogenase [Deltaproteobacteria bacterium]|nr:NAD(P)-dependent glycerol-3-phosphate dehydrogenase [Deltaproteobacteria bacterium]
MSRKIGIIGGGGFGTAIATLFSAKGFESVIWVNEKEVSSEINNRHANSLFLPGIELDHGIRATNDLSEAVSGAEMVVGAVPTEWMRSVYTRIEADGLASSDAVFLSCTKGIERRTLMMVSQVLEEIFPAEMKEKTAFLSGPSFAAEIAGRHPTVVCVASLSEECARKAAELVKCEFFRAYITDDVTGVELGGALKNIIAIAAGMATGLGFGYNTLAALITRGLWEIARLAIKMGANPLTIAGLSGTGDLILTCTGELSRNRSVGLRLGRGEKIDQILSGMKSVAEGVFTAQAAVELSRRHGVEMPITEEVYRIIYEKKDPVAAVKDLMARETKKEIDISRGI